MAVSFLVIIYMAFMSLGLPDALLGTAWPVMQLEFQVPLGYAGGISMIIAGGTILSSILSGKIINRFGTGTVTCISVAMTAAALLGFSISPSLFWIILSAFPLGLGAGAVDTGLNGYVAEHYKSHHMNWLHSFWGIGALTGPIILSRIMYHGNSWRSGYLWVSVLQFCMAALLLFSMPLWRKVEKIRSRDTIHKRSEDAESIEQPFFQPLRIRGVKSALLVFFFYCGIESTMGLWGSSYLVHVKGLDAAAAALWVSLFFGSITIGRFFTGFISMRVSNTFYVFRQALIWLFYGTANSLAVIVSSIFGLVMCCLIFSPKFLYKPICLIRFLA